MQHAGPGAVAGVTMSSVAVPKEGITSWLRLQHESKVLGPHRRFCPILDVLSAHEFPHDLDRKSRLIGAIDRRRIVAVERDCCGTIEC